MAALRPIRVLVVDDSIMFRTGITRGLKNDPQIEVVAEAYNTREARDKIIELNPDVVTLDVEMPGMNGIEFLKILMPQRPMPVIVVSAVDGIVFEAMRAGAVDFIAKPGSGQMLSFIQELAAKIKVAAVAKLRVGVKGAALRVDQSPASTLMQSMVSAVNPKTFVALGASTGGTEATSQILKVLPEGFPGMVIVQHMPPVFTRMYAERLDKECRLNVSEARDGDIVRQGHAFVAPGDAHVRVVKQGSNYTLKVGGTDKVSGHCPSVDVLFESTAKAAGNNALGVILTGMGSDGAKGMLKMRQAGAFTIGQDQQSCVVYGMPMEAYKIGAVSKQASLDAIPSVMLNKLRGGA